MKIEDVYNFIDSLSEEEFFEYLTPESYYNTNLYNSICGDNLPIISIRKLLEIYFLLSENEDDIINFVLEKMYEFSEYEVEMNGLDWYIIIFYLAGFQNPYNIYTKINTTNKNNENLVELITLNENFDRNSDFIFNDTDSQESFYTKDLTECVLLVTDRDKQMNFEKIVKTEEFHSRNISFKKETSYYMITFKK